MGIRDKIIRKKKTMSKRMFGMKMDSVMEEMDKAIIFVRHIHNHFKKDQPD